MLVPHVLLFIRTLEGSITVTNEMVISECQSVCGAVPILVRQSPTKLGQYSTSWLVHFRQKPSNLKFRLFEKNGPAMPYTRQRSIEQCQRCWGFHPARICTKSQRCGRCSDVHETSECQVKIPKYSNCAGPHDSYELKYMARPRRQQGIIVPRTPSELRIIRERGHRDFNAARAYSERKGKAVEVISAPEASMQG